MAGWYSLYICQSVYSARVSSAVAIGGQTRLVIRVRLWSTLEGGRLGSRLRALGSLAQTDARLLALFSSASQSFMARNLVHKADGRGAGWGGLSPPRALC